MFPLVDLLNSRMQQHIMFHDGFVPRSHSKIVRIGSESIASSLRCSTLVTLAFEIPYYNCELIQFSNSCAPIKVEVGVK